jgi:hypothetical protein
MQPKYAPELKIAGMALGGLIPNITALLDDPESTYRSGYALPTLLGLAKDYKNLSDWLDVNLKPETKDFFNKADAQCYDSNWSDFTGKKIGSFLKNGHTSLYEPVPSSVFKTTGQMGWLGTPKVPMYIYESIGDDASPVALADYVVKKHCDAGARITVRRTSISRKQKLTTPTSTSARSRCSTTARRCSRACPAPCAGCRTAWSASPWSTGAATRRAPSCRFALTSRA